MKGKNLLLKLSSDLTFPGMYVCHTHTQHRAYSNNSKVIIFRWEEQSSSHFNSSPLFLLQLLDWTLRIVSSLTFGVVSGFLRGLDSSEVFSSWDLAACVSWLQLLLNSN